MIVGASLLFDSEVCGFFHIEDVAFLDFHGISPLSTPLPTWPPILPKCWSVDVRHPPFTYVPPLAAHAMERGCEAAPPPPAYVAPLAAHVPECGCDAPLPPVPMCPPLVAHALERGCEAPHPLAYVVPFVAHALERGCEAPPPLCLCGPFCCPCTGACM